MGRADLIEDERIKTGPLRSANGDVVDAVQDARVSTMTGDERWTTLEPELHGQAA